MFDKKTVLVLGAGASWHYGYPTGEELVADVIDAAEAIAAHFEQRVGHRVNLSLIPEMLTSLEGEFRDGDVEARYHAAIGLCRDLANRLRTVSPLVIDYFLGWNRDLEHIGRLMIAFVLLRRECLGEGSINYNRILMAEAARKPTPNRAEFKDNWIRFVIHQLLLRCKEPEQLCRNNLNVITFNYDLSAERAIRKALEATSFLNKDPTHIRSFIEAPRFVHMYGALQEVKVTRNEFFALNGAFSRDEAADRIDLANRVLNACEQAAKDIRVIDPHNKDDGPESKLAQELLRDAERVYVLGFSFDQNNVRRLGWPERQPPHSKKVYFTNYLDAMAVNKRAGAAMSVDVFQRSTQGMWNRLNFSAEKSTRDCYQALALDFGAFEDCSDPQ